MPVAYITGATSGIGRATAERFIEEGWTVVAMARREERLQELQDAHPGSVHCFKLYGASKGFVLQFSRGLRCDLHGTGVRVTDVEPGLLESEFSNVRFKGDESRFDTLYENAHPLRPEDIADTIWWVVSRPAHVNVSQVEVMPTTQSLASARVFKG